MNLITCAEDCEYQQDGYCQLEGSAPISGVKVNGCSYFQKRKPIKKENAEEKERG